MKLRRWHLDLVAWGSIWLALFLIYPAGVLDGLAAGIFLGIVGIVLFILDSVYRPK